jgi:3-phenylpropionate/trans-cinnamate dioxygenase ferredoxin subunit
MADFVQASKVGELPEGTMKEVEVQGHELLLAMVGGKYYAADGHCPHMGGRLARGKLEGTVVTCPLHGSQFDLRDGQVVRWLKGSGILSSVGKALKGPRQLATYKVKVEGDVILIEI